MITTKDKLLVGGGLLFIIVIVILELFFVPKGTPENDTSPTLLRSVTMRVEAVEPLENQEGISVVPQVVATLTSPLQGRKVELKTIPKAEFSNSVNISGEKITFSPKANLKKNTRYNLQVFIEDQPIFSWDVTTKKRGTSQKNLVSVVNKIRGKMPYTGNDFRIDYDAPVDRFFVFIEEASTQTIKNRANDWFKKQGLVDFAAINIGYIGKTSPNR